MNLESYLRIAPTPNTAIHQSRHPKVNSSGVITLRPGYGRRYPYRQTFER